MRTSIRPTITASLASTAIISPMISSLSGKPAQERFSGGAFLTSTRTARRTLRSSINRRTIYCRIGWEDFSDHRRKLVTFIEVKALDFIDYESTERLLDVEKVGPVAGD